MIKFIKAQEQKGEMLIEPNDYPQRFLATEKCQNSK